MQAVIALCHFCENHGPRVVMTCQPMRDVDDKGASCTASTSLGPSTSSSPPGIIVPLIKFDGECVVKEKTNTEDGTSYPHYGNCTKFTIDTEDRCSACSSFRNGPCLLSNDHQTKTSYISSEVALQDRVYERVKNACLRSLSCEVSAASKKNPVQPPPPPLSRSTTPRKIHPYVIHEEPLHGTRIPPSSTVLQEPIEDGAFEQPAAEEADGYVIFGDTDNGFCFAYIFRLADAKARGFYRLFSLIVVSNDLTFLTNNFEYFKTTLGGIKNDLQKLAQDVFSREIDTGEKLSEDDIHKPEFQKLVGKMPSWYRRKIAIDTDRNLTVVTANNDIWVQLHRHMMWTLRSPTLACLDQVMEGKPTQDMMVLLELEESQIVELELRHPNQHLFGFQVSMAQLANLKIIATQLNTCSEPGDLDLLIRHIVTGGQVVVESREKEYCRQFLLAISNLLPIGCIKLATYKEQYLPEYSSRFNLIGGPHNMDIPLEVSDVMVFRVSPRDVSIVDIEQMSLVNCVIEVRRRPENDGSNGPLPRIVNRYRDLLLDSDVTDTILETALRTTREGWMLKAKICYQMTKQLSHPQVFEHITGCGVEDQQVVSYWTAGLSNAYKLHVLTSIQQSQTSTAR
ncbi:Folliculin [Caenorhabditis elegans]|uniref:Folliculin n=1 Tax=Caenorhabditis elegans TaxID=6239 RepID=K0M7B5_CAEEL|nr:Folliculin [Caenorhabditis elegans]CCJ34850.1 F22D3.2 protein [Caenorhabditis elegans]SBV53358.1 Folliculin [Caenorhabditis elegans]|eukprot:NP_001317868.1 FoLliCuliN [Caenorhabditis elegans]